MYDSTQISFLQRDRKRMTGGGSWRRTGNGRRIGYSVWKCVCASGMALLIAGASVIAAENVWAAPENIRIILGNGSGNGIAPEDDSGDGMVSGNVPESAAGENTNTATEEGMTVGTESMTDTELIAGVAAMTGEEPKDSMDTHVPIVVVDAGHGGEDEGCFRDDVYEKDINLAIAKLVQGKLTGLGYQVIMVRETDTYVAKEDRTILANESQADLYISIHQNASEEEEVQGIEVWYKDEGVTCESRRLALLVGQQTVKKTGAVEREPQGDSQIHVIENTKMPACLVETGFLSNGEERGKLVTAEYQEQLADGIVQGIEYYFHPKTMYLTFDDGPHKENTVRVLDILKKRNIKATFFVVGENVRKYPELMQRIVAEGHSIGVHCNHHDYEALYQSVDSYVKDFEEAHQAVLEVTGVDTKLFRFPGGSINAHNKQVSEAIVEEMTNRGYIYYDWNASLEDAVKDPKPEQLIANGVDTTLGREKVIMLAHDVVYSTGICLEDLLDRLPEYRMEALTEEVKPIQF